jgi:MtN3 and saliva related transmembrane protein
VESIGYIAAFFTVVSTLPQLFKTISTKSAKDVSFWMFVMLFIGGVLWLIYGYSSGDWPLIITNILTTIIVGLNIIFKIKYSHQ